MGLNLFSWTEETMELVPFPPSSGMPGMLQSGTLSMMERQTHRSNDLHWIGLSLGGWILMTIFLLLLSHYCSLSITPSSFSSVHLFYLSLCLMFFLFFPTIIHFWLLTCFPLSSPGLPSQLSNEEAANSAGDLRARTKWLHRPGVCPTSAHFCK